MERQVPIDDFSWLDEKPGAGSFIGLHGTSHAHTYGLKHCAICAGKCLVTCPLCGGTGKVLGRKEDERSARWRRCSCLPPKKRWKPPVGTRWANDQALAKRLGFKTQWEMRKARAAAKKRGYVASASAEQATPLLDRLEAGSGPVRHLPVDSWPILQVNKELRYCVPDTRHLAEVWR